jgi:PKD repeat protein/sulfur carrier protein ThiS
VLLLAASCKTVDEPLGGNPDTPLEVTAEAVGVSAIRVSWRPSIDSRVTAYELQRRSDLSGDFETIEASLSASGTARVVYFDTKVDPNRYYGYRVRALTLLGGRSAPSNVAGNKTSPMPGINIRTLTTVATPASSDDDGFIVVIRGRTDTSTFVIGINSSRLVSPLAPGTYTVLLRGLAPNCATTASADTLKSITIPSEGVATVQDAQFLVSCRDPEKASIVTTVRITGDTLDADGVIISASGIIRAPNTPASERAYFQTRVLIGANASVRFDNLRPGDYEVSISDVEPPCVLDGSRLFTLQPRALAVDTVQFALTCRKPVLPPDTVGRPFVLRHRWATATARPGDRIALLTSIDLSAQPTQEIAGVAADINFDATVIRYDSARSTRVFDLTVVNPLTPSAISFAAANTGGQGLTGNLDVVRTWYTVIGAVGSTVTTSTRLGDVLTPQVGFLNSRVRVAEGTLTIAAGAPNQAPTANISGPTTATVGTPVSFSGAGSTDPDGSIASYVWAFGDGGTGSGASVNHTFAAAGVYTVRLTVTDNAGATGTRDLQVTVTAAPATVGTVSGSVTSPQRGALSGVTVTVQGGPSAQSGVTGAYSIPGVATGARSVSLSTLPTGCTAPAAQSVTVSSGATATLNFTVVCTPLGAATGTVSGRVTRATGGAGIAGVRVVLQPTGGTALAPVTTSADGSYTITNVPIGTGAGAGTGSVTVSDLPVGCATPSSSPYTGLAAGATVTVPISVTCQTVTTGSVSGAVARASGGAAIEGATVTLTPAGGAALPAVTTSANGAYSISNVPPGNGSIALSALPTGCTNPGPQAYSGVTAGGNVTLNIAVTCPPAPVTYPVSLEYGPITNTGPTGRQVQIRVRWNVGTEQATGLSFAIGYNGAALAFASRQFTSTFDFGAQSVNGAGTANAALNAAYGAVNPAFETGNFLVIAFTFNIATGFSGSVTPTLSISEATRTTLPVITNQTTVVTPLAITIP